MIKNLLALTFLLALIAYPAASARAADEAAPIPEFSPFVITVPQGFTTSYNPGPGAAPGQTGQSLTLTAPGRSAVYTVSVEPLSPGQWESMLDQMTNKPESNTGPAEVQGPDQFLVTFNDPSTGLAGRRIYQRLDSGSYLKQVILGYHDQLNQATSSLSLQFEEKKETE